MQERWMGHGLRRVVRAGLECYGCRQASSTARKDQPETQTGKRRTEIQEASLLRGMFSSMTSRRKKRYAVVLPARTAAAKGNAILTKERSAFKRESSMGSGGIPLTFKTLKRTWLGPWPPRPLRCTAAAHGAGFRSKARAVWWPALVERMHHLLICWASAAPTGSG